MTASIEDQLGRAYEEKLAAHSRENESLRECPLPEEEIPNPLSYAYDIDSQIAELQERINDLQTRKQEAMDYALRHNIAEDERCRLESKTRKTRTLNAARFREVFPHEWEMVRTIEVNDLTERMKHAGEKINLTLVDKLVKKPVLEAAQGVVSITESVSYQVVRK